MNISSLQARVRALRRRLAEPYAQLMLQLQSEDMCDQWARARGDKQPVPSPWAFGIRVAKAGFHLWTFGYAMRYLERCASQRQYPDPALLFRALMPWAEYHPGDHGYQLPRQPKLPSIEAFR